MLLHDVIYDVILLPTIRRVSGNDFLFQQDSVLAHRTAHVQQLNCCVVKRHTSLRWTCGLQTAHISVLWITRSGQPCSIVPITDKSIVWMNWNGGSSMSGASWTVDFWRGQDIFDHLPRRHSACVHAKGGHFECSLWSDNVDFVHICFIQCNLFDCYIFYYEIIPATLANTFLFILQGSAPADFRYGGRF